MRKISFVTDSTYHIYSRGVEKRKIYLDSNDYSRFTSILDHYLKYDYPYSLLKQRLMKARSKQEKQNIFLHLETRRIKSPVEIIAFCLMPNHYHLTLKQLVENGITNFMHRIGTSYTNFFNIRQDRSGRLFETSFKAVTVDSEEQLLHLTRYQHLNPRILGLDIPKGLIDYSWSSLSTYLGKNRFAFVKPEIVLSTFKTPKSYLEFVLAEIDELESVRLEQVAIDDDFNWFAKFYAQKKTHQEQLRALYLESLSQSSI